MKKRVISAIIFGLIFFPAIVFGGVYFLLFTMFCTYLGTYELMNMFYKKSETLKYLRFIVPLFSSVIAFMFYMQGKYANVYQLVIDNGTLNIIKDATINENLFTVYSVLILVLYVLFVVILMMICTLKKNTTSHDITSCITSLTYGGLLLSAAFAVEYINPIIRVGDSINFAYAVTKYVKGSIFAYLYSVVAFTDMFALFIGSKLGRHKLCPTISPKKSVEGAIGGLIVGSIVGTLFAYMFNVMPISSESSGLEIVSIILLTLLISIVISIVEQIGDLVASKLKRSYEIKDYGFIMPGHGGVMDRFDSLITSGAILYVILFIIKILLIGAL